MKTPVKLLLCFAAIIIFCSRSNAQEDQRSLPDFGLEIRNTAVTFIPDLDLTNKILFISLWRSDDQQSRDNNKEFLRVSNIYGQAKLKNGSAGVAFINICLDPQLHTWVMSIKKDEVISKYNLENSNGTYGSLVKYFDGRTGSMVIGNDGTTLAKDIKPEDCFPLFRSFITR
jgi:hypothetical protein